MGIFSFLFKKKKVNNVEESKNAVDNASSKDSIIKEVTKDHQDICDFLLCYENYQKFINQDNYISVKNTKDTLKVMGHLLNIKENSNQPVSATKPNGNGGDNLLPNPKIK